MHGFKAQHGVALLVAGLVHVVGPGSQAAVVYNELVSGDAPAGGPSVGLGVLAAGSNQVVGMTPVFDADDYLFTIAPGYLLNAVIVDVYAPGEGGSQGSAAMQDPFLGVAALTPASQTLDFLDLASIAQPVGPGTYLFRVTTGTGGPMNYQFDFQVSGGAEVPEASTVVAMAGLGLVGAGRMWRRRRGL